MENGIYFQKGALLQSGLHSENSEKAAVLYYKKFLCADMYYRYIDAIGIFERENLALRRKQICVSSTILRQ